jgi:hypothetical protein
MITHDDVGVLIEHTQPRFTPFDLPEGLLIAAV